MSNLDYRFHWRRHLPHFQPKQMPIFLTLCVSERQSMFPPIRDISPVFNFDRFFEMDSNVDGRVRTGPLVNPRIAGICQKYVHLFDMHLYQLLTYVIMPDHMHIILTPEMRGDVPISVPAITHRLKMHIAYHANIVRGQHGRFWQQDYFDMAVQSDAKYQRIARYIYENPLRAGLVDRPDQWPWYYHTKKGGRA